MFLQLSVSDQYFVLWKNILCKDNKEVISILNKKFLELLQLVWSAWVGNFMFLLSVISSNKVLQPIYHST